VSKKNCAPKPDFFKNKSAKFWRGSVSRQRGRQQPNFRARAIRRIANSSGRIASKCTVRGTHAFDRGWCESRTLRFVLAMVFWAKPSGPIAGDACVVNSTWLAAADSFEATLGTNKSPSIYRFLFRR
jgi:hypothetical protein